jgi:hypothetical protein
MSQQQVLSWQSLLGLYVAVAVGTGVLGIVLAGLGANHSLILAIVGSFIGLVAALHVTAPRDSPASLWAKAKAKASFSLTRLSAVDGVLLAGALLLAGVWALFEPVLSPQRVVEYTILAVVVVIALWILLRGDVMSRRRH